MSEPLAAPHLHLVDHYSAPNYDPLPVVLREGQGVWVWDVEGRRYLDMLSAYSALNFGHRHPGLVEALRTQLERLTLTSRAFGNDQFGPFCADLADLCGMDMVLAMNTGAEAVETAVKAARKWGYDRKGVRPGRAKILVCDGNFHGRTTTIISFSTDESARTGFGPFTPGFEVIPYGDAAALEDAIDEDTVGFLVEPVQGEHGVVVPPESYLPAVRRICSDADVLFIADEIQSGLGRTGTTFACDLAGVKPDVLILGKGLGGGLLPISAVVSSREVLGVLSAGTHGSTFGGNPLAVAVAREVIAMLAKGTYQERAAELGTYLEAELLRADLPNVTDVRVCGLWAGIDLAQEAGTARAACERLMVEGVLCKETHGQTIRLSPPLIISTEELDWGLERVFRVLSEQ